MISGNRPESFPIPQCAICAETHQEPKEEFPRTTEPSHESGSSEEERGARYKAYGGKLTLPPVTTWLSARLLFLPIDGTAGPPRRAEDAVPVVLSLRFLPTPNRPGNTNAPLN